MSISALIIGFGTMGSIHASKMEATQAFTVNAVVDVKEGALDVARQKGYAGYSNIQEACEKKGPFDVVVVTSNTASHFSAIQEALEQHAILGRKPYFFVEKPIVSDPREVEALRALFAKNQYPTDLPFMSGYLLRESPIVPEFLKVFEANDKVCRVKILWQKERKPLRPSAGVIQDESTHSLDLVHFLLGRLGVDCSQFSVEVQSATRTRDIVDQKQQDLLYAENDPRRVPFASVEYRGKIGAVELEGISSFIQSPQKRVISFLSNQDREYRLTFDEGGEDKLEVFEGAVLKDEKHFKVDKVLESWRSFLTYVKEGKKPDHICGFEEACRDVALTDKLEQKAKFCIEVPTLLYTTGIEKKTTLQPPKDVVMNWKLG